MSEDHCCGKRQKRRRSFPSSRSSSSLSVVVVVVVFFRVFFSCFFALATTTEEISIRSREENDVPRSRTTTTTRARWVFEQSGSLLVSASFSSSSFQKNATVLSLTDVVGARYTDDEEKVVKRRRRRRRALEVYKATTGEFVGMELAFSRRTTTPPTRPATIPRRTTLRGDSFPLVARSDARRRTRDPRARRDEPRRGGTCAACRGTTAPAVKRSKRRSAACPSNRSTTCPSSGRRARCTHVTRARPRKLGRGRVAGESLARLRRETRRP